MDSVTLRNGVKMPLLGFGVLRMKDPAACIRCVREAFESGYRMFDTAASYGNEEAVGRALRELIEEGKAKREDLFIITKLCIDDAGEEAAGKAFEESCRRLQTDYIDLYLIHQPYSDYYGAWRTMERLYREGRVRAVGVSNFSPERLTDLCLNSRIPPMVNQVELHPFYHGRGPAGHGGAGSAAPGLGASVRGAEKNLLQQSPGKNRRKARQDGGPDGPALER